MKRLVVGLIAFALAACGSPSGPSSGNFAGDWTGTVTQPNGPIQQMWDYTLNLTQNGTAVSGSSHIQFQTGSNSYADFRVSGSVLANGKLHVTEDAITAQIPPASGGFWCFKILDLTYAGGHLTGPWTSNNCVNPGQIDLVKK